ncbi:MAG: type II and III secretion system protein family protein [Rhodobacteraceae bacterium]|nr:type II and III secretion system protein family protein [Paracoccaceae bacterium]
MQLKSLIQAGLMGFVLTAPMASSVLAQNAVLSVSRSLVASKISVAVNRAIVVESDRPFAELSVANPAIADIASLSDRSIYVLGKTPGATTLTIFDQDGRLVANVDVRVSPDIAEFKERLSQILPNERIEVRTANDGIVLSGRITGARKVARAMELAELYAPDRVTNLMTVGGSQQVMLQVRFAEMQRSVAKSLGSSVGINNSSPITNTFAIGTGNRGVTGGGMTSSAGSTGAIGVGFGIGGIAVNVMIEALESKGMARTLAEPNIVAISGQEANFLAGGEYPIPVRDGDGGINIEYRPFGVMLNFLPTVIDGDLINLKLETVVSSIDKDTSFTSSVGLSIPAFKVRRASTTVEMRDGQSFAIAGLMQDDFSDLNGQVPWLGDVPILGALFRSAEFQRKQTELVIIVTPHLVTPTSSDALALPTDRMRIPTEAELFLGGRTEGARPSGSIAQLGFDGSAGYVME